MRTLVERWGRVWIACLPLGAHIGFGIGYVRRHDWPFVVMSGISVLIWAWIAYDAAPPFGRPYPTHPDAPGGR